MVHAALLQHASGMLAKALLVQKGQDVFDKEKGTSIGIEKALNIAQSKGWMSAAQAGAIRVIDAMRDQAQHWTALERRRQAEATKAQVKRRPGVPAVGLEPPPHRRHGLRTLGQLDGLHIEGEAQRLVQVPTTSAPTQGRIQKSAPSELEQRETRMRA